MARIGEIVRPGCHARCAAAARMRAALVPDLLVEAHRIVNTVIAGWHGRSKRGIGENFWQFRPYVDGECLSRIDWRRSARDDHTYVRDREWEAAHTIWLWADLSPSMLYKSTRRDRLQGIPRAGADPRARRTPVAQRRAHRLPRADGPVHRPQWRRAACRAPGHAADLPASRIFPTIRGFSDIVDRQRLPRSARRDHGLARRAGAPWRARPSDRDRRSRPKRRSPMPAAPNSRDPETGENLTAGRAETFRDDYRLAYLARRHELVGLVQASRLELHRQSHRPSGLRSAGRAFTWR